MKNVYLAAILILMTFLTAHAQDTFEKLTFTTLQQVVNIKDKTVTTNNLVISIDRKAITKVSRLYIRLLKAENRELVYIKAIDPDILKGLVKDNAVSESMIDDKQITLNLGPFESGTYYLYVRIKAGDNKMYYDRQKITL